MKHEVDNMFADIRLRKRTKLRSRLLKEDKSRKKFWRFVKSQAQISGKITGLNNRDGQMVFKQEELENAIIDHFSTIFNGQRIPIFANNEKADMTEIGLQDIENILRNIPHDIPANMHEKEVCAPYTMTELNRILQSLENEKASGFDAIPNELLKNSSIRFRQYILIFLNKILREGKIPEEMNDGKCVLIYKVNKGRETPVYKLPM